MKLISMENAEGGMDSPSMAYQPCPYPYGLRLNLNQDQLAALGYDDLPPAGTILRVEAVGCVTRSSSEDADADGDIDYLCVEVQITQMGIEEEEATTGKDSDKDAGSRAGRMYGKE